MKLKFLKHILNEQKPIAPIAPTKPGQPVQTNVQQNITPVVQPSFQDEPINPEQHQVRRQQGQNYQLIKLINQIAPGLIDELKKEAQKFQVYLDNNDYQYEDACTHEDAIDWGINTGHTSQARYVLDQLNIPYTAESDPDAEEDTNEEVDE